MYIRRSLSLKVAFLWANHTCIHHDMVSNARIYTSHFLAEVCVLGSFKNILVRASDFHSRYLNATPRVTPRQDTVGLHPFTQSFCFAAYISLVIILHLQILPSFLHLE